MFLNDSHHTDAVGNQMRHLLTYAMPYYKMLDVTFMIYEYRRDPLKKRVCTQIAARKIAGQEKRKRNAWKINNNY